jgi:hypothetical protein
MARLNLSALFHNIPFFVSSLDHILPPTSFCSTCCGTPPNVDHSDFTQTEIPGEMAWLPSMNDLTAAGHTWCAEQQPRDLNAGAFNHPCIILKSSACDHLVYCAPCTSFGGRGIQAKYDKANKNSDTFYRHLSISSEHSSPHSELPKLQLQSTSGPKKSTYVVLGKGFWIEKWALTTFGAAEPQVLQPDSLLILKWAHHIAQNYHEQQQEPQPQQRQQQHKHIPKQVNMALASPCWRSPSTSFKPTTCSQSAIFTPQPQENHSHNFSTFVPGSTGHNNWAEPSPYVMVDHGNNYHW